jgi:hypothetical protein
MKTLDELFAVLDSGKRVVKKNVQDAVNNPADYVSMVAGRLAEKADIFINNRSVDDMVNVAFGGIMAGPKAASKAVQDSLEAGQRLALKGYDADFIFEKTGRFISPGDRMARVEIPDTGAKFKHNTVAAYKTTSLEDLLDHPQLFEAYPQLKDIVVKLDPTTPNSAYTYGAKTIDVGTSVGGSAQTMKNLLHEIQHAVQREEGFAKGGNVGLFKSNSYSYNPKLATEAKNLGLDSIQAYYRLAGEAESRAVESRLGLDEMLRVIHPEKSYDVPLNELLVRD